MKPEDFKPIHSKEERITHVYDRVWFIPHGKFANSQVFAFPGWSHADFFGNDNPISLEYCSGNGAWIASKAMQHPSQNWVAVEMKFDRVRKIWSKIKNHKLDNLIVICGEGLFATSTYFEDASISEVYINFPDPWPKKRHIKNRIIQDPFMLQMGRILKPLAPLNFVTDDAVYSDWFIDVMLRSNLFESHYGVPYYSESDDQYGTSYFNELWRSKGKQIRYHKVQNKRIS